jgi:hypothetical protein
MRSGSVGVASVVNVENNDSALLLVDAVPHAVLTPASPPHAFEGCPQSHPDHAWTQ